MTRYRPLTVRDRGPIYRPITGLVSLRAHQEKEARERRQTARPLMDPLLKGWLLGVGSTLAGGTLAVLVWWLVG